MLALPAATQAEGRTWEAARGRQQQAGDGGV